MLSRKDLFHLYAGWGLIAAAAVFRLLYAGSFPLVADETNYWQWGRHLDWGYHDNAPMIGWAIRLATELLGHTETAVRLPSVAAMTVASIYLMLIALRWFSPVTAFHTALLSQGILEFNVGGLLATTDGLQAAGWAAASYHVARAFQENRWPQWLLGGFWFGFGLLSKYTMVLFLPGAFAYGLFSHRHRERLAGIRPYAGLMLGVVMFSPVIAWNIAHGWNSARHVAHLGGVDEAFQIHFKYFGEYLAGQAGLVSPLVFILILAAWRMAFRSPGNNAEDTWINRYLFWTSFPMFAGFALLSLHTRVYANWPGAAYLTASVMTAARFGGQVGGKSQEPPHRRFGRRLYPWAVGSAYCLTALLLIHVVTPILPVSKKIDRVAREIAGWDVLGRKAAETLQSMPRPDRTFLFGLRYQIASELAFYTPGNPETVAINKWNRPNVYDYWKQDEELLGWDAVGASESPDDHETKLNQVFERVEPPLEIIIHRDSPWTKDASREPAQTFYLYRAYGFKGGLRWDPPDAADIRAGKKP
ncbi:MAG: glycosyltransferase family 39 protein [Thermodesulfobacteriota bacterium]